jgi:hypothetical protein
VASSLALTRGAVIARFRHVAHDLEAILHLPPLPRAAAVVPEGTPWAPAEFVGLIRGLERYGSAAGSWEQIARDFVPTRTAAQVAAHARTIVETQSMGAAAAGAAGAAGIAAAGTGAGAPAQRLPEPSPGAARVAAARPPALNVTLAAATQPAPDTFSPAAALQFLHLQTGPLTPGRIVDQEQYEAFQRWLASKNAKQS